MLHRRRVSTKPSVTGQWVGNSTLRPGEAAFLLAYEHDSDTFPGGFEAYISALRRRRDSSSAETLALWLLHCIDNRLESLEAQLELISGRSPGQAISEIRALRVREAAEKDAEIARCRAELKSRGLEDSKLLNILSRCGYDGSSTIKVADLKGITNIGAKGIAVLTGLGLVE